MQQHSTSPPSGDHHHGTVIDIGDVGLTAQTGRRSGADGDIGLVASNLSDVEILAILAISI